MLAAGEPYGLRAAAFKGMVEVHAVGDGALGIPAVGVAVASRAREVGRDAHTDGVRAVDAQWDGGDADNVEVDDLVHIASAEGTAEPDVEGGGRGDFVHHQGDAGLEVAALHRGAVLLGLLDGPLVEHAFRPLVGHEVCAPCDGGARADGDGGGYEHAVRHQGADGVDIVVRGEALEAAVVVVYAHIAHLSLVAYGHAVAAVQLRRGRGACGLPHQAVVGG